MLANLLAVAIGTLVGAVAGFLRGWTETLLMRFTDIMMAFPTLLLAMTLVAILKPGVDHHRRDRPGLLDLDRARDLRPGARRCASATS